MRDVLVVSENHEPFADLLVMGAWGRSRFGERLFGGATRHVLRESRIPVLMRH